MEVWSASLLEYFVDEFQKTMNFLLLCALCPLLAAARDRDWSQQEVDFRSGELRTDQLSVQTCHYVSHNFKI